MAIRRAGERKRNCRELNQTDFTVQHLLQPYLSQEVEEKQSSDLEYSGLLCLRVACDCPVVLYLQQIVSMLI